ncbi:MAG: GntR family transcriptional regulator [Fimbriimonadaceae bacterium]
MTPKPRLTTSLRDVAYEEIKRRIITLAYQPGAYVNEAQICQDLGIGRTPVHMALERLANDGMIDILPRKGAIVRSVSLDEINSIIEARLFNEPAAARLAAERATEVERLKVIAKEAHSRTHRRDIEGLMQLDRDFHSTIADATRNRVLAQILKSLHERALRLWFISLSDKKRQEKVADEHDDILAAIASKNGDRAERVMREHIVSFSQVISRSSERP